MKKTVLVLMIAATTIAAQTTEEAQGAREQKKPLGYTIGPGIVDGPPVSAAVMAAFTTQATSLYSKVVTQKANGGDYRLAALATQTLFAHAEEFGYDVQLGAVTNTILSQGVSPADLTLIGSYQTSGALTPLTAAQITAFVASVNYTGFQGWQEAYARGGIKGLNANLVAALNGIASRVDQIQAFGGFRLGKPGAALLTSISMADLYTGGMALQCNKGIVTLHTLGQQGFTAGMTTLMYVLAVVGPTL